VEFDTRVGAYAVISGDQRILLTHWVAEPGLEPGWTLPGGGLEFGEDPRAAAVREVTEETGYAVELIALLGTHSVHYGAEERGAGRPRRPLHSLRVIYEARVVGGELTRELDGSTDDAVWVPLVEVLNLPRVGLVDVAVNLWRQATHATATGIIANSD